LENEVPAGWMIFSRPRQRAANASGSADPAGSERIPASAFFRSKDLIAALQARRNRLSGTLFAFIVEKQYKKRRSGKLLPPNGETNVQPQKS
jgi:hypothetical protein